MRRVCPRLPRRNRQPSRDATMLPGAYICHQTAHRLRLKIPGKRGDIAYFTALRNDLSGWPDIQEVQINPTTASVLLVPAVAPPVLARFGMSKKLFALKPARPETINQRLLGSFRYVDEQLKASTSGELDLASLAFLGLVGAGTYQILMGNFFAPAWYTAFWYGASVLLKTPSDKGEAGMD